VFFFSKEIKLGSPPEGAQSRDSRIESLTLADPKDRTRDLVTEGQRLGSGGSDQSSYPSGLWISLVLCVVQSPFLSALVYKL